MEAHDLGKIAYICCYFIGAFAAIIYQLWNKANEFNTQSNKGILTVMLEVIIYLKDNAHLWDNIDVVLAYRNTR